MASVRSSSGEIVWKPGDDPNSRDGPGRTPLHHVCQKGSLNLSDVECIRSLLAAKADPNFVDGFGRGPLSLICMETGNTDACLALVTSGADVNAKDDWGRTALHWCCDRGWKGTAKILIEHGSSIDAMTTHGDTPLLWAAKAGRVQLVELLLAAGCRTDVLNNRGESAASVAQKDIIRGLIFSRTESRPEVASPLSSRATDEVGSEQSGHQQKDCLTSSSKVELYQFGPSQIISSTKRSTPQKSLAINATATEGHNAGEKRQETDPMAQSQKEFGSEPDASLPTVSQTKPAAGKRLKITLKK